MYFHLYNEIGRYSWHTSSTLYIITSRSDQSSTSPHASKFEHFAKASLHGVAESFTENRTNPRSVQDRGPYDDASVGDGSDDGQILEHVPRITQRLTGAGDLKRPSPPVRPSFRWIGGPHQPLKQGLSEFRIGIDPVRIYIYILHERTHINTCECVCKSAHMHGPHGTCLQLSWRHNRRVAVKNI